MTYTKPLEFQTEEQQAKFVRQALFDTGFLARWILGYNYDVNDEGERINIGSGGIRKDGNHRMMTQFLDDESSEQARSKHMQSPRGSFKTTCIQSWLIRKTLADRNIRILYGMHTYEKTLEKLREIKEQFEGKYNNNRLPQLFGSMDPKSGELTMRGPIWSDGAFTLNGRTIPNAEPTFTGFGVDRMVTGGHYSIIVLDDLVHEKNVGTSEGIAKVLRIYRMIGPLLENGGILIVNGTRYADGDLYGYIMENQYEDFTHLIVDVGVDVERQIDGTMKVVGQSTFPHISVKRLQKELNRMDYEFFCAQYLNKIVVGIEQPFKREHFQVCRWEAWMKDLSVYFLCDVATSKEDDGCYSAIVVIGVDAADHVYVLDTSLGHMEPESFKNAFFQLYMKWLSKCWIRKVSFEQGALGTVFRAILDSRAKQLGLRLEYLKMKRGKGQPSKKARIKGLQPRFNEGRISFCADTLPATFIDVSTVKCLFDPEGFTGEYGNPLPDGEIVQELIRHPRHPKNDWADALADVEAIDDNGIRKIRFIPPSRREHSRRVKRRGQRVSPLAQFGEDGQNGDWFERTAKRMGA